MATAAETQVREKIFIGGDWVEPELAETLEVIDSVTEEAMGTISAGSRRRRRPRRDRGARRLRGVVADLARGAGRVPRRDRRRPRARMDEIATTISEELGCRCR